MEILKVSNLKKKLVINICGAAGAGKSYSALDLARGMVSRGDEVCVIDTENKSFLMQNHPAYINNDLFNVLMLPPNEGFGLDKMFDAINMVNKAEGVKVCIIDSFSSIYSDFGGMKDVVKKGGGTLHAWGNFTQGIAKLKGIISNSNRHFIFTTRAEEIIENGIKKIKQDQKEDFTYLYHIDVHVNRGKIQILRDNTGIIDKKIDRDTGEKLSKI